MGCGVEVPITNELNTISMVSWSVDAVHGTGGKVIKNLSKKRSLADAADVRNNVAPKCQNDAKID